MNFLSEMSKPNDDDDNDNNRISSWFQHCWNSFCLRPKESSSEHSHVEQYSVTDFSRLRRATHKSILRERKLLPPSTSSSSFSF